MRGRAYTKVLNRWGHPVSGEVAAIPICRNSKVFDPCPVAFCWTCYTPLRS